VRINSPRRMQRGDEQIAALMHWAPKHSLSRVDRPNSQTLPATTSFCSSHFHLSHYLRLSNLHILQMRPKRTRHRPPSSHVVLSDSDLDMPLPPSSASTKPPPTPSPKKPSKYRNKLDSGARSSPLKSSPSKRAESPGTDVSSDVNEVQFEDPGAALTRRRHLGSSEEEDDMEEDVKEEDVKQEDVKQEDVKKEEADVEVIDVDSEEEVVVKKKRVAKKVVVSDSDDEEKVPVRGNRKRVARGWAGVKREVKSEDEEEEVKMSAKRAGKRKAITISLSEDSADDKRKRIGRAFKPKKEEPEVEESEEDILDGLDEDGECIIA
jgi:hypothetical protein